MSWASITRTWFDELFYSSHTKHLEAEILYLRNELGQARIDRDKLQLMLNTVNTAGQVLDRKLNPPQRPISTVPTIKRWAVLQAERQKEIDDIRIKKMAEQASKAS